MAGTLYNQNEVAQACPSYQIYGSLYYSGGIKINLSWFMYLFIWGKRIGLTTGRFFANLFRYPVSQLEFMKNPQVAEEVGMTLNIGQWLVYH